jgi:peptidoglycan-N-acetylglucosamine deacetylase
VAADRRCRGCADRERLGRRRFLKMLAGGLALAAFRSPEASAAQQIGKRPRVPLAPQAPILADSTGGPPVALGQIPPAHPGSPVVVSAGPAGGQQIALTVDDGYCGECIAQYVDFALTSGTHITFNPNGSFQDLWTPQIVASVRQMVANKQVQFGNHTWDHANLLNLSTPAIVSELNRNEDWIQQTFGITARPYFRPPYGYYNQRVIDTAASIGYTKILMWNGSFGDSTVESPDQIISLAEQYLKPGTIMLGHLNHPAILSIFGQITSIIESRNLQPVTLDEMFGTSRATG